MIYFYSFCALVFLLVNLHQTIKHKKNKFVVGVFSIQVFFIISLFFIEGGFLEYIRTCSAIGSCCLIIIYSHLNKK